MDNKLLLLLAVAPILLALLIVLIDRRRTRKTMDTIEQMLGAASEGNYAESHFDESRLSALETKFSDYLSSCALSAQNVTVEKDKIKQMISDISHQTKTPIANLMLYSELLSEEELTPQMRSNVEAIRQQSEKLRFLIDSLVKLSRLENGILTLSPHPQPLQPLLDEIAAQYTRKADEKGLTLTVLPTAAAADFDGKWTAEALGNLVDNAIKYTESGSICVGCGRDRHRHRHRRSRAAQNLLPLLSLPGGVRRGRGRHRTVPGKKNHQRPGRLYQAALRSGHRLHLFCFSAALCPNLIKL